MKKHLIHSITLTLLTLLLTACGGGGGGDQNGTHQDNGTTTPIEQTAYDKVKAVIAGETGASITAGELNSIDGVSGAIAGKDYLSALQSATYTDRANPTAAEIQAVIDAANAPAPVNHAPSISGVPTTTIKIDSPYSFIPTASDADTQDTLVFSITNKPSWATFDVTTGTLNGTPTHTHIGTTTGIVISVTDGTATVSLEAFTLEVKLTNHAPTISGTPAKTVDADSPYSFIPTASDTDTQDTLVFSITNKPSWATFDTTTGTLSGTPTNANAGTTSDIVISVNDGTVTVALAAFDLTVNYVNHAPTINGKPDTTLNADTSYSFKPTASDSDDDKLTFSITNKPDWATFDTATGALSGTPTNTNAGATTEIVISVSDDAGGSVALDAFDLEVLFYAPCVDTDGDKGYAKAAIVTGKTLTKTTTTTQLHLWHTADNERRACTVEGGVEIE